MKNKVIQSVLALILVIPILFSFTSTSSIQAASTQTAYVDITSGVLNVRSEASTKSKIVGSLKNKNKVIVYSVTNGWAKIKFKNKNSYVSNQYLRYYKYMSQSSAKEITDRVIKIQNSLKKSYTKKQIKTILSPAFTDSFINKFYKYDLVTYQKDKYGNALYEWNATDFPAYVIMYGITWDEKTRIEYKAEKPKITYYKKNGIEYLLVSQKYPDDEMYSNIEQKIYLSRANSKSNWKVYNTSW